MKRVLSVVLSVLLILSFGGASFAAAGDTGFSSEISADIPAGSWLIVTFSQELMVQAIFANYS